jgi:hypothetical protein
MSAATATPRIYSQHAISALATPIAQSKQSDRLILAPAVSVAEKAHPPCIDSSGNSDPFVAHTVWVSVFSPWQPGWQALTKVKLFG